MPDPQRTCVACRQTGSKPLLARFYRDSEGLIRIDQTGRAPGRGGYLHQDRVCIEGARRRRALDRALKGQSTDLLWESMLAALVS